MVATTLLVILSPILAIVAILVRCRLGPPVFFRQLRIGRDAQPFSILKFRTMTVGDAPDADRLTRLGAFLRRTSFDELPELVNVLRGEMSIVGPRPLLPEYLPLYSPEQARRHEVSPGITGYAQVNGRNILSWDQKLELDVWYVDHRSFALDLTIIARTVAAVFSGKGVASPGSATTEPFRGSSPPQGLAAERRDRS
jgi:sugar transferase EpsL